MFTQSGRSEDYSNFLSVQIRITSLNESWHQVDKKAERTVALDSELVSSEEEC